MTVRTQNMDILSAVAGKHAAPGGGLTRTAAADGGTPFVDLMAALGAQSEPLVDVAKQTVLIDRQPAATEGIDAHAIGVNPLQLLARRSHDAGVTSHEGPDNLAGADDHVPIDVQTEGDADLPVRRQPDELEMGVAEEESKADVLAPDEARAAVQPAAAAGPADASVLIDARDVVRAVTGQVDVAERVRVAIDQPAVAREAVARSHESRLPGVAAAIARRQDLDAVASPEARGSAELVAHMKVRRHKVEAEPVRDRNRALDTSSTFSDALFRAAHGAGENPVTTLGAAKEARSAQVATMQVPQAFGSQQWGVAMNAQVLTMMRDGVAQARVQINPENLGPVGIDLSMRDGVVNVRFDSPYTEVREALRDGVKGLERSLSEGGVQLGRVEVRDSLDFMAQGRSQREPQQDPSGGQRQQQEWRQSRRGEADFASHLQVTDEDNAGG